MAMIGTLTLTGESGTEYTFNVYPYSTEFKAIGAVYYISKRTENSEGKGSHTKIYVGQTGDLSERFDNHHKEDCFIKNSANCKSVLTEEDEDRRFEIETDLVIALNPPCNG
jgi:predicted GIY-YIG superfamily endonuclease